MSSINEKARNKMLVIKGILAEKCGLSPELYDELSRELDEFVMIVELDKNKQLKLIEGYNPDCIFCHGTGMHFIPFFAGGGISEPCHCNLHPLKINNQP